MSGIPNMNKIVISSAAFAIFAAITFPASAASDMKCGCYAPLEAEIEAGNPYHGGGGFKSFKYNLSCESKDRFTTPGTAVSVQKRYLKVYVDAKNAVQGDGYMDITFRSRNKTYFAQATDLFGDNGNKTLWSGLKNDTDKQNVSNFTIIKHKNGTVSSSFLGATSDDGISLGKGYSGFVLFNDLGDGKKTMTALCLEDDQY
jgi:hypothetical protein